MGWDCSLMGLRVDTVYPLLAIKQVYSSLVVARTDHGKGQLRMLWYGRILKLKKPSNKTLE